MFLLFGTLMLTLGIMVSAAAAALSVSDIDDAEGQEDKAAVVAFTVTGDNLDQLTFSKESSNDALVPDDNIVATGSGESYSLTIVPASNKSGQTTIRLTVSNGTDTVVKRFLFTVTPINDAPVLTVPGAQETDEDGELIFSSASGNAITATDIDVGNDDAEITLRAEYGIFEIEGSGSSLVQAGNGTDTLVLNGPLNALISALDGLVYTPAAGWSGEDRLSVKIDDLGHNGQSDNPFATTQTDTEQITVSVVAVNDAPVITVADAQTADEDVPLVFSVENENPMVVADEDAGDEAIRVTLTLDNGLLDAENESEAVTVTGSGTPEMAIEGPVAQINTVLDGLTCRLGAVTESFDNFSGKTIYTREKNWNGDAVLTVTADDNGFSGRGGALSDAETVNITVMAVNDAPVIRRPGGDQRLSEGESLVFGADTDTAISVSDADAGENTASVVLTADAGALTVSAAEGVTADASEDGTRIELTGPFEKINMALDGLTWSPDAEWNGEAVLTITADDLGFAGEGGPQQTESTVNIEVGAVNDAPILDNSGEIRLTAIGQNVQNASGERVAVVLHNRVDDSDDASEPAGMAVIAIDNTGGAWQYSTDGASTWSDFDENTAEDNATVLDSDARIRFVPDADWTGKATITFRAWDGSDGSESADSGVDAGDFGGSSAFSPQSAVAFIIVGDADVLIANAGPDQAVFGGESVSLDGLASVIPAGMTATRQWTQIQGPDVTLSGDTSLGPVFTAPDADGETVLIFELTLTGPADEQSSDTVEVTVTPAPVVLQAHAGSDQDVTEGETVTLDGSGSTIPPGMTVTRVWAQTGGPDVVLSDAGSETPVFTAPEVGTESETLTFTLTLGDGADQESADDVVVTVLPRQPITADAGTDQTVGPGDIVTLDGAASYVPTGVTAFYKWEQTGGETVALENDVMARTSFIAPDVASGETAELTFALTVSDNAEESDTATVTVTVKGEVVISPPVADAGEDQSVARGDLVTLKGSGTADPDASIVAWRWQEIPAPSVVLSDPDAAETTFTAPNGGVDGKTLEFELTVTDNVGNTGTDRVKISVARDIPEPSETFKEGDTVTLTVSDPGDLGPIVAYAWTQVSGPSVTLSDPAAEAPAFVAPSVGAGEADLVFRLELTDVNEKTGKTLTTIRVVDNGITGFPDGVLTFKPTSDTALGISVSGKGDLVRLMPVDPADITDNENRPKQLLYGLFDMGIKVENPGDTVSVTVYLQKSAGEEDKWFKYSEGSGWQDYSAHAIFNADRTRIILTLTDGGIGDDGPEDGMITDPSGLGSGSGGSSSGGGDGDDGGSCFIDTVSFRLPVWLR
ncbi:hypothetical protein DENIS_0600 [Desulfonema ishimotonii]|uniref:PKD/Chitinase domain-containing protein n=1 Tax=Desulfonema ishimotonii TaxID=45657 RepID=A0A401FRQ9_9BACT|nr:hypothetical protein DENIS_0600 [Desulfonema ishimotonii]